MNEQKYCPKHGQLVTAGGFDRDRMDQITAAIEFFIKKNPPRYLIPRSVSLGCGRRTTVWYYQR